MRGELPLGLEKLLQAHPVDVLEDHEQRAVRHAPEVIQRYRVWVSQRRDQFCFLFELFCYVCVYFGDVVDFEDFDCYWVIEYEVGVFEDVVLFF